MISFFPTISETIVLSIKAPEVVERLQAGVDLKFLFGRCSREGFQMTAKTPRPTQFQPLINGVIEESSRGCILLLTYQLLLSTRLYLAFWLSVVLVASAVFAWNKSSVFYFGVGLLICLTLALIVRSNLKLQSVMARQVLLDLLS